MFFLWTITLPQHTEPDAYWPTSTCVHKPVSSIYTSYFLISSPSLSSPSFPSLLVSSFIPLPPSPSTRSVIGQSCWPLASYWPGRLLSNVLPDQSRLWNSPESWIIQQKRIQNYVLNTFQHRHTARSVKRQVDLDWPASFRTRTRPGKWGSGFSTSC